MAVRFIEKALTFLIDIISFNVAFTAAIWIRYQSNIFPEFYNPDIDFGSYFTLSASVALCWVALFFFTGLYRDCTRSPDSTSSLSSSGP
jgi:hypothetical protein